MVVLPLREQLILLATFVIIFIVFWIDEKRIKDKNHILNKIFYYLPSFNSNQRTGFMLLAVAAICAIFGVALYLSIIVLFGSNTFNNKKTITTKPNSILEFFTQWTSTYGTTLFTSKLERP